MALNIEKASDLTEYLQKEGHTSAEEGLQIKVLRGGVSNRTVWVQKGDGTSWVLKQALEKLRVQTDWYSHPRRIQQEALGLEWFSKYCPEGSVPKLIFFDQAVHLLGMEAILEPHDNYKGLLLKGDTNPALFQQLGSLLGIVHRVGQQQASEIKSTFEEYSFFESLRLEPYYAFTAHQLGATATFFQNLIADTRRSRYTLVHGDYSPKNILIYQGQLVLLDYEVVHFGDGTFDVGFLLTHLLSKANHLKESRKLLIEGAKTFWKYYQKELQKTWTRQKESRAVAHTVGCLLARVHGRSPLEYLSPEERDRQTQFALAFIQNRPNSILELIENFQLNLSNA